MKRPTKTQIVAAVSMLYSLLSALGYAPTAAEPVPCTPTAAE